MVFQWIGFVINLLLNVSIVTNREYNCTKNVILKYLSTVFE